MEGRRKRERRGGRRQGGKREIERANTSDSRCSCRSHSQPATARPEPTLWSVTSQTSKRGTFCRALSGNVNDSLVCSRAVSSCLVIARNREPFSMLLQVMQPLLEAQGPVLLQLFQLWGLLVAFLESQTRTGDEPTQTDGLWAEERLCCCALERPLQQHLPASPARLLGLRSVSSGSSLPRKASVMRRASSAGSEGPFLNLTAARKSVLRVSCRRSQDSERCRGSGRAMCAPGAAGALRPLGGGLPRKRQWPQTSSDHRSPSRRPRERHVLQASALP